MDKNKKKELTESLLSTFLSAGKLSLELRSKGLIKEIKEDKTPVTNGDLEVDKILTSKIMKLTPEIPIVSEESSSNKKNESLKDFWLIDPIDGTYDYVNNGEEFTLNAALVLNKIPEIGIIYAPAKKRLFYSYSAGDSYEIIKNNKKKLDAKKKTKPGQVKAVSYSDYLKPVIASSIIIYIGSPLQNELYLVSA